MQSGCTTRRPWPPRSCRSLVCPSDLIPNNPVQNRSSGHRYGLTSYGGNGGTRSFHPDSPDLQADGMFFEVGPASRPVAYQRAVTLADVRDGASHTLLVGERNHRDANYDSFAAQGWEQTMGEYGYWTGSGGNLALGDVTLSSYAELNYHVPFNHAQPRRGEPSGRLAERLPLLRRSAVVRIRQQPFRRGQFRLRRRLRTVPSDDSIPWPRSARLSTRRGEEDVPLP